MAQELEFLGEHRRHEVEKKQAKAIKAWFSDEVVFAYFERLRQCLGNRIEESGVLPYRMGLRRTDFVRWENRQVSISFPNYLGLIHVFDLDWTTLDVDSRRRVIREAILSTLERIQAFDQGDRRAFSARSRKELHAQRPSRAENAGQAISDEEWELLKQAFRSPDWHAATRSLAEARESGDAHSMKRCHQQVLKVAAALLAQYQDDTSRRHQRHFQIEGSAAFLELIERWGPAFCKFLSAVPYRWSF